MICLPELNYLQVNTLNIEDSFEGDPSPLLKNSLAWHDLYYGNFTQSCKLRNSTVKINLHYDKSRDRGLCGGDDLGHLTMLINNKTIIDNVFFNSGCSILNLRKISYTDNRFKQITLCGTKEDDFDIYKAFCFNFSISDDVPITNISLGNKYHASWKENLILNQNNKILNSSK